MSSPGILERPNVDELPVSGGEDWVVVVFNNDVNTFDEVIAILMVATHCSFDEAYAEAWDIDHFGKTVVHHADQKECEKIADIIRMIGVVVEVRQD